MLEVKFKRVRPSSRVPVYATEGSSGLDLFADIEEEIVLNPFDRAKVPTGIALEIPEGYEAEVRPRSGLALEWGVTLINSPGTIDSDYRGEIFVLLINLGKEPFLLKPGMRIAQLVFKKVERVVLKEVNELGRSERGEGGFGHTGYT